MRRCEPLDALTGGTAQAELRELWRSLLQNHPHDSICGCSIDAVHDVDMRPRFAFVRERGTALAERLARTLAGEGDVAMLFDPLPYERDAVVDLDGAPTRVRSGGIGVVPLATVGGAVRADGDAAIENEHLRVEVAVDGTFTVVDRATGARTGRMNALISEGDRGDEYTYSYAGPTVGTENAVGMRRASVHGDRAAVTVALVLRLPTGLRPDRLARSPALVECPVRTVISLDSGARRVDVSVTFDNRAKDHRVRVLCETGTKTITHAAGAAFARLERQNRFTVRAGWIEPATADACVHDLVTVEGATRGLAVGVDGLRDYAVLHDGGTIAITLLRAVGFLSRGDLRERRGHAGPELETPSAQCLGENTYRYTVVPLGEGMDAATAARGVYEWLTPPIPLRGDGAERCLVRLAPGEGEVVLSALRAARDGALVVRLFNPAHDPASARLHFARAIASSRPVDLREGEDDLGNTGLEIVRTAAPLEVDGASATVRLQPYEIGTWLVRLS